MRWWYFILLSFFFANLNAQDSPYKLSYQLDIPLITGATGLGIASLVIGKNIDGFTVSELNDLDRSDVNRFDRSATYQYSKPANISSDVLVFGSGAAALSILANKNIRKDYLIVGTMAIEAFAVNMAINNLVKVLVKRPRPLTYNSQADLETRTKKSSRFSFYSGHTSTTAVLSFFVAKVLTDYNPQWRFKPLIWSGAAILPLVTAMLRYKAGKHYFTDVITGYAAGALIGYLIPFLHKTTRKKDKLVMFPTFGGESILFTVRYRI